MEYIMTGARVGPDFNLIYEEPPVSAEVVEGRGATSGPVGKLLK